MSFFQFHTCLFSRGVSIDLGPFDFLLAIEGVVAF